MLYPTIIRCVKWAALTFLGLIVLAYIILVAALKYTSGEKQFESEAQESVYARSLEPHSILLIDSGASSLDQRLKLIESAKESIELEFFIFNIDRASRILTSALLKKAREGVKIRLLVDFSAPVFQLRPAYAQLMKNANIEVKYYNTISMLRFFSVQHRSHRKLLIADGRKVITGGRNIADDYFDLSAHYNFLDSDVLIEGPIVKTIKASFDLYWNSNFSKSAEQIDAEIAAEDTNLAKSFFILSPEDVEALAAVTAAAPRIQDAVSTTTCNDITFITDFPGHGESHRKIYPELVKLVSEAKNQMLIESPYFVLKTEGHSLFKSMKDRNIKIDLLTNGLFSTDAYYVISALQPRLHWIAETGLNLHIFNGLPIQSTLPLQASPTRWGIHSKRAVIDTVTTLIGTYNIDPRSANLNSELVVICRDGKALADQVTRSITERKKNSKPILLQGEVVNPEVLFADASWQQVMMTLLFVPVINYLDILL